MRAGRRGSAAVEPVGVHSQRGRRERLLARCVERFCRRERPLDRQRGRCGGVHSVEHQPGERHLLGLEPLDEVRRFAQRVALRHGDDDERRTALLEQLVGLVGALAESAEHRLERGDEQAEVLQCLRAEHPVEDVGEHLDADGEHLEVRAAAGPGGCGQHPDHPAVEEAAESLRRVEEVQRGSARWSVDDDEVPRAGRLELAELLHRHVLLRAGEARGQRDVEGVREDRLRARLVGVRRTRCRRTCASCRASSRRADRRPTSSIPATSRGVLSSSVRPIDCASRRAGSMVSTQTVRPCSAARSASAAAVVVLPTPPAPQHTMISARHAAARRRRVPQALRSLPVRSSQTIPAACSRSAISCRPDSSVASPISGSSYVGRSSADSVSRSCCSSRTRPAWSVDLAGERGDGRGVGVDAGGLQAARDVSGVDASRGRVG